MSFTSYFSPDYATARDRFLSAARACSTTLTAHRFEASGPQGEALTTDVAYLGASDPERVVIVSSGLHGVEGFFGSAVQLAWLSLRGREKLPPRTRLVMVHALNPYGFAWQRRWNENNVDLNRNFLDDWPLLDTDPFYGESRTTYNRFANFLNPPSPPSRWEPYPAKAVWHILSAGYQARRRRQKGRSPHYPTPRTLLELGLLELQKTLPVGQYEHPKGLFYGGTRPEQTVRLVRKALPQWVKGADKVVHLDFHTGLGKYADYRLLLTDESGSERAQQMADHFGEEVVEAQDGKTAYAAHGVMAEALHDQLGNISYYGVTAEFGTYSSLRVLGALRAENQAHFFDHPGTASYRRAKRQLVEVFCPSAPRWREDVVKGGLTLIKQAVEAK